MKIIGVNLGETSLGMKLNDGGACLVDDQGIVCIAEERVSRKKYSGGFEKSLEYCLSERGYNIDDIDLFVVSSCCEVPRTCIPDMGFDIQSEKIVIMPSHHLSHAYSVYMTSKFEEAIIMVIDNEGSIINNLGNDEFYKNELEHMTYYVGKGNDIEFLERDSVDSDSIGIGDAYRYFTHYLGFPSYVYAGKTMGLAPYGNEDTYKDIKIFDYENDKIRCLIKQDYFNCTKALADFFLESYNIILPPVRNPIDDITQDYADLAYLIQRELEEVLIKKVNYLIQKTGIKKLCIAGGVGLNSVANGRLLRETELEDIYIVPAAGDTGQCLGNALYAYHKIFGNTKRYAFDSAYLGKEYSEKEIQDSVSRCIVINENIEVKEYETFDSLNKVAASLLSEGKIIARFGGKSEFGPRALGNRSILMDPRKKENKDILNKKVKFREEFRPFAPVVLSEYVGQYFDIDRESPYMMLVAEVKNKDIIPAVTHVDGSARVQTLNSKQNPQFYSLIQEFQRITGVPVILNTSFNIAGEPIVETPDDALECFLGTNIDYLIMGKNILSKIQ